ncbi:MAG TPA: hypothetical protein VFK44_02745 [Bacillales bacterium]|nr:hypothetical protein [Bacillales bacterium]
MKKKSTILQIAAAYIGTVIGAGFATGKEIVEFFLEYGHAGLLGIALCGIFFTAAGTKIMLISHRNHFRSYEQLNRFLFGNKIGKVVNVIFLIVLLGTSSVMVSGTGSIFHEQLGWSSLLGVFVLLTLCFLTISKGISGIFAVNMVVVPIMLSFSFLAALFIFFAGPHASFSSSVSHSFSHGWWFSAVLYASFNLATAQAVLVPLGGEIEDESALKAGGWLGGIGLTIILLTSFFVLSRLPEVFQYDIPMAEVVRVLGPLLHALYVVVIFGEIFTTVIGNVFGLTRQIDGWTRLPNSVVVLAVLTVCFFVSLVDFSVLLSNLYRLFGAIGIVVLAALVFRRLPRYTK